MEEPHRRLGEGEEDRTYVTDACETRLLRGRTRGRSGERSELRDFLSKISLHSPCDGVSTSIELYWFVMRGDVHKLGRKGAPWFRMVAVLSVRHEDVTSSVSP